MIKDQTNNTIENSFTVQFEGLNPTPDLNKSIKQTLERIHRKAPYGSQIRLTLKKKKSHIYGDLKVIGKRTLLEAKSIRGCPSSTLESLSQRINEKIGAWRSLRDFITPMGGAA